MWRGHKGPRLAHDAGPSSLSPTRRLACRFGHIPPLFSPFRQCPAKIQLCPVVFRRPDFRHERRHRRQPRRSIRRRRGPREARAGPEPGSRQVSLLGNQPRVGAVSQTDVFSDLLVAPISPASPSVFGRPPLRLSRLVRQAPTFFFLILHGSPKGTDANAPQRDIHAIHGRPRARLAHRARL